MTRGDMMKQSTPDMPIPLRRSARIVLLNHHNHLLLMNVVLPDRSLWCTIGGGIKQGETPEIAAARETFEETGLADDDITWQGVIWQGEHLLDRNGTLMLHQEIFILAYTQRLNIVPQNFTEQEKTVVKDFKWWTLQELWKTTEFIVPPSLIRHIEPIMNGQVPKEAYTIDLGDDISNPAAIH